MRRLALVAVAASGAALMGAVLAFRLLGIPDAGAGPLPAAGDARITRVLTELVMRGTGVSTRSEPLEVSAPDLNGFLARHVEARRLPLRPLYVLATAGRLEVAGRTTVARLEAAGGWTAWLVQRMPDSLRQLEVWVSAQGPVDVRAGEAVFRVDRATVGRQPVPVEWLWRAIELDPRAQLTWRLPSVVERISIEPGRVVIHTRRSGA